MYLIINKEPTNMIHPRPPRTREHHHHPLAPRLRLLPVIPLPLPLLHPRSLSLLLPLLPRHQKIGLFRPTALPRADIEMVIVARFVVVLQELYLGELG